MRKQTVNARSELYAILGDPIIYAMSPLVVNSAFDRNNIDSVMVAMKVNCGTAAEIFPALKKIGLKGCAVTMPVKGDIARLCDELKDEALLTGVVNCVAERDGKYIGYNTDSMGFWDAVQVHSGGNFAPKTMFILGAGGFAKAAVAQAALRGVKHITVANRLEEKELLAAFGAFTENLKKKLPDVEVKIIDWKPELWTGELSKAELIGNGTSNGMNDKGDLHEIFPYDKVAKDAVFFDAVYKPLDTKFRLKAKSLGHRTVPGIEFMAQQAANSFKIWTGLEADAKVMLQDAADFLAAAAK